MYPWSHGPHTVLVRWTSTFESWRTASTALHHSKSKPGRPRSKQTPAPYLEGRPCQRQSAAAWYDDGKACACSSTVYIVCVHYYYYTVLLFRGQFYITWSKKMATARGRWILAHGALAQYLANRFFFFDSVRSQDEELKLCTHVRRVLSSSRAWLRVHCFLRTSNTKRGAVQSIWDGGFFVKLLLP